MTVHQLSSDGAVQVVLVRLVLMKACPPATGFARQVAFRHFHILLSGHELHRQPRQCYRALRHYRSDGELVYVDQSVSPAVTIYKTTSYDTSGRVSSVTNPYRYTTDATYGSTSYTYDGLNRVTQTALQDGNTMVSYFGAAASSGVGAQTSQLCSSATYGPGYRTLLKDEAGKKRQTWLWAGLLHQRHADNQVEERQRTPASHARCAATSDRRDHELVRNFDQSPAPAAATLTLPDRVLGSSLHMTIPIPPAADWLRFGCMPT
jgi:hypothetical protein